MGWNLVHPPEDPGAFSKESGGKIVTIRFARMGFFEPGGATTANVRVRTYELEFPILAYLQPWGEGCPYCDQSSLIAFSPFRIARRSQTWSSSGPPLVASRLPSRLKQSGLQRGTSAASSCASSRPVATSMSFTTRRDCSNATTDPSGVKAMEPAGISGSSRRTTRTGCQEPTLQSLRDGSRGGRQPLAIGAEADVGVTLHRECLHQTSGSSLPHVDSGSLPGPRYNPAAVRAHIQEEAEARLGFDLFLPGHVVRSETRERSGPR